MNYDVVGLKLNTDLLLQFFLLLILLGTLGSLHLLLYLGLAFLEGGKELGKEAGTLGAFLLLGLLREGQVCWRNYKLDTYSLGFLLGRLCRGLRSGLGGRGGLLKKRVNLQKQGNNVRSSLQP